MHARNKTKGNVKLQKFSAAPSLPHNFIYPIYLASSQLALTTHLDIVLIFKMTSCLQHNLLMTIMNRITMKDNLLEP